VLLRVFPVVTVAVIVETCELSIRMVIDIPIWGGEQGGGDIVGDQSRTRL
jgi:hypothetical protein